METARRALATTPGAACRREYVDQVCSTIGERSVVDRIYQTCMETHEAQYNDAAQAVCVSAP